MQGRRRTELEGTRRTSAARGVFTLAALLSVFLQAFIVQTHVHALSPITQAAIERSATTMDGHQHAGLPHGPAACVVCQALAANGGATLPETAALHAPQAFAEAAQHGALHVGPRAPTHDWQSRAPPILL